MLAKAARVGPAMVAPVVAVAAVQGAAVLEEAVAQAGTVLEEAAVAVRVVEVLVVVVGAAQVRAAGGNEVALALS